MNKAILILDMPDSCIECPCRTKNLKDECVCNCLYEDNKLNLNDLMHKKPNWCPLKEVPKEEPRDCMDEYYDGWSDGYNYLRSEILGE